MESSDEEDDYPSHEFITPQESIDAVYQSDTEKGIRRICSELLDLKEAVENLCGNMRSKYLAFLRLSEEVGEVEQEVIELQRQASAQGAIVQDLISGVSRQLDVWKKWNNMVSDSDEDFQISGLQKTLSGEIEDPESIIMDKVDMLLVENKLEEAIVMLETESKRYAETKDSEGRPFTEISLSKVCIQQRKAWIVDKLIEVCEEPSIDSAELKKALTGLVKLGEISRAHQLLLKAHGVWLHKKIEAFISLSSIYIETYAATLSQLVFSAILLVKKHTILIFGDLPTYSNRIMQWAEYELESFVHLVKENAPSSETSSALRSASICYQASLTHCSKLDSEGLKFSKLLVLLIRPYVEEVFDLNFRRARRRVLDLSKNDGAVTLSRGMESTIPITASFNIFLTGSGKKFMTIVKELVDPLTPFVILHLEETILNKIRLLFDKYVEILIKALPGPSEDDNIVEPREAIDYRAETDAEQLALFGTAFTVADELLPMAVSKIFNSHSDRKEGCTGSPENISLVAFGTVEYKEWRRHLQHSLDKLRDHFCRQYVLTFIYSREGNARLDAQMYLEAKRDDLFWDSDPLPSLPFQGLFARLQQLASVASDVLLGKEKIQKILLSRLTETVVMWLSDEQEFWEVFEIEAAQLQPFGLQQLILDMHFIVEIAVCGGYPSRNVQQIVSAIITRAIGAFSAKGIDPQSALPEDEWFVDTAKAAINKLLLGTSGSESFEGDEHIIMHVEISDSDDMSSTPSEVESEDSFASANNGETDSPVFFSDSDG